MSDVLMGFQLISNEQVSTLPREPPSLKPTSTMHKLKLIHLGLRNLQGKSLIQKPFVRVSAHGVKTITTKASNHPSSKDPNFLQVMSMEVDVPDDPIFFSALDFTVVEQWFGVTFTRAEATPLLTPAAWE
jgi:hypothetical protein